MVGDPVKIGSSSTQFSQKQAFLRLFGVNDAGNSVLAYVHNFMPYFYVPAWANCTPEQINLFGQALNALIKDSGKPEAKLVNVCVIRVERVKKQSVWGYQGNDLADYLQVTVALPAMVATARRMLEKGITINSVGFKTFTTYESSLAYVLRYMIDKNLRGGGWVEVKANHYRPRVTEKTSHCQLEVDVHFDSVVGHNPDGEWLRMAPMRILSFDIECAGRKGFFPEAHIDPIIQIASIVSLQHKPATPIVKNIFTLNTCAPIAGAQVIANETEGEMLMNWLRFFVQADADFITGYNITNFDLPYLLDRAKALKLTDFPFLGRIRTAQSTMKDSKFESKGLGKRESKEIKIEGRVQFDLLELIRRDYKLRSYTLNAVSAHFLQSQKEDVHHSSVRRQHFGTWEKGFFH